MTVRDVALSSFIHLEDQLLFLLQTWQNKSPASLFCCLFLGICLPLRKLPLSHDYLSASPQRDLWRLTSPVKSTRKHWTITPAYFTRLSPILPFHSGLLSTQPHLISTLLMWQSEAASLSQAKWHEWHVGILLVDCFFFLSQPLTPAVPLILLMHQILYECCDACQRLSQVSALHHSCVLEEACHCQSALLLLLLLLLSRVW